ncbi:MAG: porin family protein [Hyphomonadaceae bacterium JAD_PAG50586_4]|nr:MAG: porin family protein [Hyphomonadaceae bacterium JAD_PAG50586_4]
MKTMKLLCLVGASVLTLALTETARADALNVSVGYQYLETHIDGVGDADVSALVLRGERSLSPLVSLEGELALGVDDDSLAGGSVNLDYSFSAFVAARVPFTGKWSLHGRLGAVAVAYDISDIVAPDLRNEWAPAAGVGAQYQFASGRALRLDYTRQEFDDADVDSASLSLNLRF